MTEARSTELGIDDYTWSATGGTEGDGRTRELHRELHGTAQKYSDPPVVAENGDRANPGEYFQCRCSALPDVEGFLDSLGV